MLPRRAGPALLAVLALLLASSCSADDDTAAPAPSPGSTSSTSSTPSTSVPPVCSYQPVSAAGELTWLDGDRIMAADRADSGEEGPRCLIDGVDAEAVAMAWNGTGERLLVGPSTAIVEGRFVETGFAPSAAASWSYPTGTAVLGRLSAPRGLEKHELATGEVVDLTFIDDHESAVYHPAGLHVVSVGEGFAGYGIYLATNTGSDVRPLALGESAPHIGALAWTPGGGRLLFAADHGEQHHLHVLDLETSFLDTLAVSDRAIVDVNVSQFDDRHVAWVEGDCRDRGRRTAMTARLDEDDSTRPVEVDDVGDVVGWLEGGRLAVVESEGCEAGRLLVVEPDGATTPVADGVRVAAVRAPMVIEAPPPPDIPSAAPA